MRRTSPCATAPAKVGTHVAAIRDIRFSNVHATGLEFPLMSCRGNAVGTGEIGYPYLLQVLAENGRDDVIFGTTATVRLSGLGEINQGPGKKSYVVNAPGRRP